MVLLATAVAMAGPGGRGKGRHGRGDDPFKVPSTITLTAEQQAKVEQLRTEYGPKIKEANDKVQVVMTPDRRKAAGKAAKEAKAAGKAGPEVKEAVTAALGLSEQEKSQLKTAKQEQAELNKRIRTELKAVLTPEQRAQLPQGRGKGRAAKAAKAST